MTSSLLRIYIIDQGDEANSDGSNHNRAYNAPGQG
jgi:hypothetical protein